MLGIKALSTRTQILILVITLTVVALASLVAVTIRQLTTSLSENLEEEAVSLSSMLAESVAQGLDLQDSSLVTEFANAVLANERIVGICICDGHEMNVFRNIRVGAPQKLAIHCKMVDSPDVEHLENVYVASQPILYRETRVGDIWLALSKEPMQARINAGITQILIIATIVLLMVIIVGHIISRKIVRPIRIFEHASHRITGGDMVSPIEIPGLHKDFLALGAAFNRMQDALKTAFQDLRQSRDGLEDQVKTRTEELEKQLIQTERAVIAQREMGEQLRATLESTADGMLVVNKEGETTHANRRFAELWCIPPVLLATRDDKKLLDFVLEQLIDPQAFLDKVLSLYDSTLESFDTLIFKDGRTFERYSCPLIQNEEAVGRVWSFRDVTERMQAEEALRITQFSVDHSADAAFWMTKDAKFFYINNTGCKILGYDREELLKMTVFDIDPYFQEETWADHWQEVKEKRTFMNESVHRRKDGTEFPVEVTVNYMEFEGKEFNCTFARDITQRKRAERQQQELTTKLERAERMESLGILAGGVAHDLNNMLGPLVGYPELMLMKLPEDSPIRKQVIRIGNAARDAADVVQDLLTLARRGRYDMVPVNLNTIIRSYADSPGYRQLAARCPRVEVNFDLDDTAGDILGSTPHLSKVIMNLIVNAFDAMHEGGTLTVSTCQRRVTNLISGYATERDRECVLVSVRDTGTGIAEEDLDKIFEPYYSKKKMGASGSGLGLSVVYGVVKDHDGYYDVISEPDQGTDFILYFPITRQEAAKSDSTDQVPRGNETILVIDDVEDQRKMAAELLESLGYSVSTVSDGHEALLFLKNESVGLVVLDMIMEKDFDGLDTYREILKLHPAQRAVVVSGFSATERVTEMQKLGAGSYIKKPYTRAQIGVAVRATLDVSPTPAPA